mgnify:FL=1
MKRFRVEKEDGTKIVVTLHQPPYEDENILNKTGWSKKSVKITEIKQFQGEE